MYFNQELIDELNLLVKFNPDSMLEGLKIHHTAEVKVRHAAVRLFDKGFISQEDGGYLTDLGRELLEHVHNAGTLLTSERCI